MKVYAHTIGTDQSEDVLVFEELDDTVFVDITSTKDNVSLSLDCLFFFYAHLALEICHDQCQFTFFVRSACHRF
jgi:protease II